MDDLIIRGGLVVSSSGVARADVAVRDGRIAAVRPAIRASGAREVDASGLHVLPGGVDVHVHLGVQNAGMRSRDDHLTGTRAALCGGITTVGDFTEQGPHEGLLDSIERRLSEASVGTFCDWFLHANLTSVNPAVLDEIPRAVASGIASFKVFLAYPGLCIGPDVLREVLLQVGASGALLMAHCEDQETVDLAVEERRARRLLAPRHFFASRPAQAEARAIALLGVIAREVGHPVYVVHLSSAVGLRAALEARRAGARLYLETCPHYLLLGPRPRPGLRPEHLVCAPPLRRASDRVVLRRALVRGDIEVLATDHCPFTSHQKATGARDFRRIPGGLPGVETLLPFAYDLALRGLLPFPRLAEVVAEVPARLFGLGDRKGAVREGLDADLVLADPSQETIIHATDLHSATDYSPYEGLTLRGRVNAVYLRGRLAAARTPDGRMEPVYTHPFGRYLTALPRH